MRERDARSTALKNADTIFQKRHLEVSTAAAHGADALVGSVASVRGGEPKRVAMSQLQHEELCGKRQSRGKGEGREGEAGERLSRWRRIANFDLWNKRSDSWFSSRRDTAAAAAAAAVASVRWLVPMSLV